MGESRREMILKVETTMCRRQGGGGGVGVRGAGGGKGVEMETEAGYHGWGTVAT